MANGQRLIARSEEVKEGGVGIRFEIANHGNEAALSAGTAFVIRHQGCVHAYINQCAHVAVELDWMPGEFFDRERIYLICSTHGALYQPDTGYCVSGPCSGRSLVRIEVVERDGGIYLKD